MCTALHCHLGKPNTDPTILAIVGKQKKQTDKSSTFCIEGGNPVSYCLWAKCGLMSERLNKQQWLAVQNAMRHRLTLIQGPPGELKHVAINSQIWIAVHYGCAISLERYRQERDWSTSCFGLCTVQ